MDLPELGLFKSLENGRSKVAHLEVCHNRTDQEYMKHAHDKAIIQKIHVQSYNSKRYMYKAIIQKDTWTSMLIGALFTIT